jgi:predicted ATPase
MQPHDGNTFSRLRIDNWRQFAHVSLDFHPTLTVLTGANASGKTTLLNILGRHFNWATQLLSIPVRTRSALSKTWKADGRTELEGARTIGHLCYSIHGETVEAPLQIHDGAQTYDVNILGQQLVPGVFISSHRSLSSYQQLANLPLQFSTSEALWSQFTGELLNRWRGHQSQRSPLSLMKEGLISAAIYGEGNSSVEPDPAAMDVWVGFQRVLKEVLPISLEFEGLAVRMPDLIVITRNSEFLLESMSGGVSAIIELTWQIFLRSQGFEEITVCIDEPENHLHPSLQRSLIPGLISAFPRIKFVVATHSPFIVTAVPDSNVYVLDNPDGNGVVSQLLEHASKSATSDSTLRRVLGLDTTVPVWVERRLQDVLDQFPTSGITPADLERLRLKLTELGMRDEFPAAVDALIERG